MSNKFEGKNFSIPNFLSKDYSPQEFELIEGSITTVRSLSDLPPWVLERIPELKHDKGTNYVIKQYNKKEDCTPDYGCNFSFSDRILFDGDNYPKSLDQKKGKISVVDQASILTARQRHLRRYFGEKCRKFLLDQFFITSANRDGNVSLYEIQKKLPTYFTLGELESDPYFIQFSTEQKLRLVKNIRELEQKLREMLDDKSDDVFSIFLPDFHNDNIAITENGDIFIFDINHWVLRKDNTAHTDHVKYTFQNTLDLFLNLLEIFKNPY